jgi:N-acetylglucosaminyldiphosphoundecaprenol N-acetyl-beta-D-mannosaminyltransferase
MIPTPSNINILGISYDVCDEKDVMDHIHECIGTRNKLTIIQPHFFHTLLGNKNVALIDLYRKYDLVLPDGYGVYIASRFLHGKDKSFKRVFNGTDFYDLLLREANLKRWRIFFFGDTENIIESLKRRLGNVFPEISIAGAHHGFIDPDDEGIVSIINASHPDILIIGMGTPKQDYWLWNYHHRLDVPVSITVGAGIGFMSGDKRRAPKALRRLHLEWLYRLLQEPLRLWRRYLIGIPKFVFYIYLQKIQTK